MMTWMMVVARFMIAMCGRRIRTGWHLHPWHVGHRLGNHSNCRGQRGGMTRHDGCQH
ncbi:MULTISPECIES: hypothetical protein [Acetobacter]|uniref:Secreted protein n=1 Tax=Acetobacter cerevisiae TaxID=178900 RepID=A0ABT1EUS1_9PROT|nr:MULTISPECIES: hypothetical protein [Acetobacter]MCP1247146.1 hypothetical protein [Acetobacter cerevisiae]MCP1256702.1 hypothetical protein [Acetobacter cerevisiae]